MQRQNKTKTPSGIADIMSHFKQKQSKIKAYINITTPL